MKKLLLLSLLLITIFQLQAQDEVPWKYRALYLGGGPRTLAAEEGSIEFSFVDDSPSMDNLQSSTPVEDNYNSIGIQFGFMWGRYNGMSYDLNLDFSKNTIFELSVGYTMTMAKGYNTFSIRPSINGGLGAYGFDLGDLENNGLFIQIGEKQFFGDFLNTRLNSSVATWGPRLDFFTNIGEHLGIILKVNYDIASSGNLDINFSDPSSGEDQVTFSPISLKEDTTNPDVRFNGEKLTSLPFDTGGLRISIGVAYVWNKFK